MNGNLDRRIMSVVAVVLGLVVVSCHSEQKNGSAGSAKGTGQNVSSGDLKTQAATANKANGDIVETVTGPDMRDLTTLVTALNAAGLVDLLKAPGPFTFFAPTNEAFARLPGGRLDDLLKPENKPELRAILLYHVHQGDAVLAGDMRTMPLSTLNGAPLQVVGNGKNITVNDVKVIKSDVLTTNGVIHWVDQVLVPTTE